MTEALKPRATFGENETTLEILRFVDDKGISSEKFRT